MGIGEGGTGPAASRTQEQRRQPAQPLQLRSAPPLHCRTFVEKRPAHQSRAAGLTMSRYEEEPGQHQLRGAGSSRGRAEAG